MHEDPSATPRPHPLATAHGLLFQDFYDYGDEEGDEQMAQGELAQPRQERPALQLV